MVEFSKILKKIRGAGAGKPHEKPVPFLPESARAVPKDSGPELSREPARRSEPRRAGPVRVPGEEPLRQEDKKEEGEVFRFVKPFFSQKRLQSHIGADAGAATEKTDGQGQQEDGMFRSKPREAAAGPHCPAGDPHSSLPTREALGLYERMLETARGILDLSGEAERVDVQTLTSLMDEVVGAIVSGDERLIELAVTHLLQGEESYLPQHCVNVTILSLTVGQGADFDAGKMVELGLTAFLHDIGMAGYTDMARVHRPLTPKEFEKIKEHVEVGQQILREIHPGLSEAVLTAQYEIHERADGSGYPKGRRSVHEYAKIIALVDTFESMIHPRPFRPRYSIMDVYKSIFSTKQKYDAGFIKALVDRLGFFPNGSFIQLNTKEVGRVTGQNRRSPLRPIACLCQDEAGRRLYGDAVKEVDLMKYPTLHVVTCFLEDGEEAVDA